MSPIDPTTFSQIRDWLEVLYFASGIIVMLLICFGLWQLKIAKDQLETTKDIFKIQCKRAAVESAVIECRAFSETCIQSAVDLRNNCREHSNDFFKDAVFKRTEKGFEVDVKNVKKEDLEKLQMAEKQINSLTNGLEAFALFFLSGVADEEIAFHSSGAAFIDLCEMAFKLYPLHDDIDDESDPIQELYFLWSKKIENQKLKLQEQEIKSKLSQYEDKSLTAIGT